MKNIKQLLNVIMKDKWNMAIAFLILLVIILGIIVVGVVKTILVSAIVVIIVLAIKNISEKGNKKNKRKLKKSVLNKIILIILIIGIVCILLGIAFIGYVVISAPKFDKQHLLYKEASVIYDRDSKEVLRIGQEMRDNVTFDEIPQVFVDAIVATEDSRFFEHDGFDLPRFLKASAGQLLGHSGAGGASTIDMQVIKNNFTSTDQSIVRKFTDIYLSVFKLEKNYTKEQILEFYVNGIHLGVNNTLGIAETSRGLFGKEISDINLSQAALLAGMFQAPGAYNPYKYPDKAAARRHTVLYLMNLHGYITDEQMKIADSMPISSIIAPQKANADPYQPYIDYVSSEIQKNTGYDPMVVPMKIYTNLDRKKQDYLNNILNGTIFTFENNIVQTGIAVTDVNTGGILALGAGRNRNDLKVLNYATGISRQPGSTAKPLFDYGPGMEYNNWSTYTPFLDDSYTYSDGKPINDWDGKYNGLLTLRYALGQSRNVPALKAFQQVDNKKILSFVESLGIQPEVENGRIHEAHAIGGFNGVSPLQMASAYSAFANGGYYIKPHAVNKIEYIDTGKTVEFNSQKTKVMSDSTAYMIANVLKYAVDNSLVAGKVSGIEIAAKSGTSNFDQATKDRYHLSATAVNDLWYTGFSPDIAVSMWYGYDKISSTYYSKTGSTSLIRDRLFNTITKGIFDKNGHSFSVPSSVVQVNVEKDSIPAMLPSQYTPSNMITAEYFKKGTEPTEVSPRFNTLPNVTSLDANQSGSEVQLTWNAANVPSTVTDEYMDTIKGHEDYYLSVRRQADASMLGNIGYNVYLKKSDGSLQLLGWTANTSFKHTPNGSGSLTYIVKTCYSSFKSSESSGASTTLSDNPYVSVPLINLKKDDKGNTNINISAGAVYTDPGVIVQVDSKDVTSSSTLSITVTKASDGSYNQKYTSISGIKIDTTIADKYIISYSATYNGVSTAPVERTVTIQ